MSPSAPQTAPAAGSPASVPARATAPLGEPRLSAADLEAYRRDGYVVKTGWYAPARIQAAQRASERIVYGGTFADYLADPQAKALGDGIGASSGHGREEFPTGSPEVDGLCDDPLVEALGALLGAAPFYQHSHIFPRAGNTDRRHAEHPWQGYHVDHDTYSFLVPSEDLAHEAVTAAVFLTDVDADCAPLHVVPGTHRRATDLVTRALQAGGDNTLPDIRDVPGLPPSVPTLGPAGTVLFYSTYLLHAAVPFRNKRAQRLLISFTAGRAAHACTTLFAVPYRYGQREHFAPLWSRTTPCLRSFFGWPPVGDPYYTPATLAGLALRFPGIDLTPYHAAWQANHP